MSVRLDGILTTMASALSSESIRMSTTASNLANAGSTGSSENTTYRAKHPVFSTIQQELSGWRGENPLSGGLRVTGITQSSEPLATQYDPSNPLADKNGRVYMTDVNPIAEMTNMIAASKEYQADIEVMNTTKSLLLQTIHAMNS